MATEAFFIRSNGLFYDVIEARSSQAVVELLDCRAEAVNYRDEYQASWDALEAEEAAQAREAAKDALIDDVQDFLRALDRGHLGDGFRFSDGTESAFITSLRNGVAPFQTEAR